MVPAMFPLQFKRLTLIVRGNRARIGRCALENFEHDAKRVRNLAAFTMMRASRLSPGGGEGKSIA